MAVAQADLSIKRATNTNDPATNGGPMTATAAGTTLFPDVTGTERTTGTENWRKIFLKSEAGTGTPPEKVADPAQTLLDAKLFLYNTSASDGYYLIKGATFKNGYEEDELDTGWCATGDLVDPATPDLDTIEVRCEINGSAGELFQNDSTVLIISGSTKEFLLLDSVNGVTWNGNVATLYFPSTPIQYSYDSVLTGVADIVGATVVGNSGLNMTVNEHANKRLRITAGTGIGQKRRILSNTATTFTVEYAFSTSLIASDSEFTVDLTQVCQCVSLGDLVCEYTDVQNYGSGTFTPGITLYPAGCVDEVWTLLFGLNGATVTITGASGRSLGVFAISGDIKPNNGSSFFFKIDSTAFGGTFTSGQTVTFETIAATGAAWIKEVIPPGSLPHLADSVDIGASGDTI